MNSTTHATLAEVDYVIIGAGSAGCVLANRLSADPGITVAIIEAGGPDRHPMIKMPVGFLRALMRPELGWGLSSEPEPELHGRRIPLPRGKVHGGSSSINGMFHIRGHRLDFDAWRDDAGCRGWGYDDVLPYFRRSETSWRGAGRFHGADGPLRIRPIDTRGLLAEPLIDAARAAGHELLDDYDGEHQIGIARGEVAIDARGRRSSSASAYLRPALGRRNLHLFDRARVTRLLFEGASAAGVVIDRAGRRESIRARREVLICAGAYHSPQLLMLSGIGPAAELQALGIEVRADSPRVGANLIEHPRMMHAYRARGPITYLNQMRFDRAALAALRWAVFGSGPFANQICSATVLLRTDPSLTRPDIQLLCNPIRLDAALWFPGVRPVGEHSFYITVCLLHQKSRGRVSLRSADPGDAPRVELKLFSHPDDLATMRAGLRAARAIYAQPAMAALIEAETIPGADRQSDAALDASIRELGGITHHPVGTCAMGGDPGSVLDPQLRVRGVTALRVVDASVMPTITGANTNAATVMIAERAADLILGRLAEGSDAGVSAAERNPEPAVG
ncbi:MAG: GMC family oxidoreductase N-terminal domain-containing protein [Burkholderiaceae bacterium]